MDCKHAYFKDDIPYVLCRCEKEPRTNKLRDVSGSMCGYQRFCPNIRACALLPTWPECRKLSIAAEPAQNVHPAVTQKIAKKKKF